MYYFIVLIILAITMFAPFSEELYFPIANALIIVPITSVACNRLILSLRGMVFSKEVVRGGDMGLSRTTTSRSQSKTANGAMIRPSTAALRSFTQSSHEPVQGIIELGYSSPTVDTKPEFFFHPHGTQAIHHNPALSEEPSEFQYPPTHRQSTMTTQTQQHARRLTMDSFIHQDFLPSVNNSPSWKTRERRPATAPDSGGDVASQPQLHHHQGFAARLGGRGRVQRLMEMERMTPEEERTVAGVRYPSGGPKSIHPMNSSTRL
ncbi:hypothetical protein FRC17_011124 [Serendipita sp. 399]|nr:hypothetical protein FRC17_011124 [Serendipita sp. 399]